VLYKVFGIVAARGEDVSGQRTGVAYSSRPLHIRYTRHDKALHVAQDMREQLTGQARAPLHIPLHFYAAYLDSLSILLWPRFKALLDAHVTSLRQVGVWIYM